MQAPHILWSLWASWPLNHCYKIPHHIPLGWDIQLWGYEPAVSPSAQQSNKAILCVVQSPSQVRLFVTPWTAVLHTSLSLTISWSLPKFISIALVMLSSHLILWCLLLLLPWIFPGIRDFSNESVLCIR